MDIFAQLIGIIIDGISQNCVNNRSYSTRRNRCNCCCNPPPCCSQEASYEDDFESESTNQIDEPIRERTRLIKKVPPSKRAGMVIGKRDQSAGNTVEGSSSRS